MQIARIKKYYKKEADLLLYPPVDIEKCTFESKNQKLKNDYYVAIAPFEPNKRGDLIVEAAKSTGIKIKILGEGSLRKKLRRMAKGFDNIEFLGWVTEEEKYTLLAGAKGLIFAGIEDFGITQIEAVASGTPIIAYKAGGSLDVVKDKENGVFFKEQSSESLSQAILEFEELYKKENTFNPELLRSSTEKFSGENFQNCFREYVENWFSHFNI